MDADSLELNRLDVEWITVVSAREVELLATKTAPAYKDVLSIVAQTAPTIFNETDSWLMRYYKTTDLEIWQERARSLSIIRKRQITVSDALQEEIDRTREQIEVGENPRRLRHLLERLENLLLQVSPDKYSENQAINRDAFRTKRYSPRTTAVELPGSGEGRDYREFDLGNRQRLRLRIAHPEQLEAITGADIIYEHYDEKREHVRLVALQYKMWDGKQLYIAPKEVDRVKRQLSRLETSFCSSGVCNREMGVSRGFRMPGCAAYLRPTDKLQRPDVKMQTSGYHVPACELEGLWELTSQAQRDTGKPSGIKLTAQGVEGHSISMPTFEELFNAKMLGSDWIPVAQLKALYEKEPILNTPTDSIGIHAQVYKS